MGGKVLVPTGTMVKNLKSARLAADIAEVPLIILARTDANAAKLITNDYDENDKPFLTGERSPEGFFYVKDGIDQAISSSFKCFFQLKEGEQLYANNLPGNFS